MPAASFDLPLIFEALSRVCADVSQVDVVYGTNIGTAQSPIVVPISDDPPTSPTILLLPGAWSVIVGGMNRFTFDAAGTIFCPRDVAPGEGLVLLMQIFARLFDAFTARSKAYEASPVLQSVVLTEGPGLQSAEWPPDSEAWYLTWPFGLEVKVNVPGSPQPR
ncbi:MAG TPA: hypothetical protein VN773_07270 [Verrucomicrobiae bacterium]|nr:hypothetical protein [Verrucomicrobiae bacterium]